MGSNCGLGSNPGGDAIQYIGGTLLWFSFLLKDVFSLTSWVPLPNHPPPPPPFATPTTVLAEGFLSRRGSKHLQSRSYSRHLRSYLMTATRTTAQMLKSMPERKKKIPFEWKFLSVM